MTYSLLCANLETLYYEKGILFYYCGLVTTTFYSSTNAEYELKSPPQR